MPWKKIAILLAIIAAIHAVIIVCLLPDKTPEKIPEKTPETQTPGQEKNTAINNTAENKNLPETKSPVQKKDTAKVVPWNYRKQRKLPPPLSRRAKRARSGIIIDMNDREVLWSKEPRRPVAVASLTKLMTALLVAEKMERDPEFKWTTILKITDAAAKVERSCVLGLKKDELYMVGELMQSMMINSHNDSAAQLAEAVSGSVPAFVSEMNRRSRELGLKSANFNSPNGLPQGKKRINSFASAEDITYICEKLIPYDRIMKLCVTKAQKLHTGKTVYSHNNLLGRGKHRKVSGIIGFKTGFTNAAGCCLAFGVKRNGKTVIGCVTGFPSAAERDIFCREIIEWAYQKQK